METAGFDHVKTGVFTLSAWVKPTGGRPTNGARAAVVSLCDAAKATAATVAWNGTHFLYVDATRAVTPVASSGGASTPDEWHHVAVSFVVVDRGSYFDAGAAARAHRAGTLYVDGAATTFDTILPPLANAVMTVGAEYGAGSLVAGRYFDGYVDEVRLMGRAVTGGASEVRHLAFAAPTYANNTAAPPFDGLKVHFDFEDAAGAGSWSNTRATADKAGGTTATISRGTAHTVAAMPFEPVNITSLTRPYAPYDQSFAGGHRVPAVKGGTVTVVGCCFARTPLTTVTMNGVKMSGIVVAADGNSIAVPVPPLLAPEVFDNWTAPLAAPIVLTVSNGDTADARVATATIGYDYVPAEDFAVDVVRHLEFKGSLNDARDARDGSLAATAGGGTAMTYVPDRNGDAGRAADLAGAATASFTSGRVGDQSAWTLCAWIRPAASTTNPAVPAGGVVYSERASAATSAAAAGNVNALAVAATSGELTWAGQGASPGSAGAGSAGRMAPDAWQFVCATRRATSAAAGVELFAGSDRAGTVHVAAPTAAQAAASPTAVLGGGSFAGALDDLWVLSRALAPAEVARLHGAKTLAPRFDGVAGRFSLITTVTSPVSGGAFRSSAWRGGGADGNLFTVEAWVKPSTLAGLQPIFHAPAASCPLCGSATPEGYHGVYLGLDGGRPILFMLSDPAKFNAVAVVLATLTRDAVVPVNAWTHLAATFNGTHSVMAVNGVPALVRSGVPCDGSIFCRVNAVGGASAYPVVASDVVATLGSATFIPSGGGTITRYFNGQIGRLALYTRALLETELAGLARCPHAPGTGAPVGDMFAAFDFTSGSGGVEDSIPSGAAQARWSGHAEFLGGGNARAVSWESAAIGPGHGVTWRSATVVGKAIDRADVPGEAVEATIQARDECGRPWTGASLPLRATLVGPLDLHLRQTAGTVTPTGATGGVYTARWATTQCGHHALRLERATVPAEAAAAHLYGTNALYNNSVVGQSPYKVMIKPGAAVAARSFVAAHPALARSDSETVGPGMVRGVPVTLVVRAVDAYGCPLRAGGDAVAATLKGREDVVAAVVDKADGTYEVAFTPTQAGPALLRVTLNGQPVGSDPPPADHLPRCAASSVPAPTGAPYEVTVADRGAALIGRADLPGADSPAPAGPHLAIAAWVKPIAAETTDGGLNRSSPIGVVARGVLGSVAPAGFSLELSGDATTVTAKVGVDTGVVRAVTAALPASTRGDLDASANSTGGAWTHVAAVYSAGTTWRVYVDGTLVETATFPGPGLDLAAVAAAAPTTVGDAGNLTLGTAAVDDVRVYVGSEAAGMATAAQAKRASECPPGAASGGVVPHTRLALDEGAGSSTAATDGGATASLAADARWLPAGAPSLIGRLAADGSSIVVTGVPTSNSPLPAGAAVNVTVAPFDSCGVALNLRHDAAVTGRVRLLEDVGTSAGHTGTAHPRVANRTEGNGGASGRDVSFRRAGPAGVGNATGELKVTGGCGSAALDVAVDGVTPSGSPFTFTVAALGVPSGAASEVSLAAEVLAPGVAVAAVVQTKDAHGCPVTTGGSAGLVWAALTRLSDDAEGRRAATPSAAAVAAATTVDLGDGTYEVRFAAPAEGRYALDVALKDPATGELTALTGSPIVRRAVTPAWAAVAAPGTVQVPGDPKPPPTAAPLAAWTDESTGDVWVLGGETAGRAPLPLGEAWKMPAHRNAADAFAFRRDVQISGVPSAGHEVKVTVDTATPVRDGKMRADCADASFLDPSTGAAVAAWMDPHPGCAAAATAFWLRAPRAGNSTLHLRYGAAAHAEPRAAPEAVFTAWAATAGAAADRPNGYNTACDAGTMCWEAAAACGGSAPDAAPFSAAVAPAAVKAAAAPGIVRGGETVLRARVAAGSPAGALTWRLPSGVAPLRAYVLRAHLYDNDARRAVHWMSVASSEGGSATCAAGEKPTKTSSVPGVGVFTPGGAGLLAAASPWRGLTAAPRRAGWRALEVACDGAETTLRVDGAVVDEHLPAANLSAAVLHAGHVIEFSAAAEPEPAAAYWAAVYVARADSKLTVALGVETPEAWVGAGGAWVKVSLAGTAPSSVQATRGAAAATLAGKVYVWGGLPAHAGAAVGTVHALNLAASPPAWSRIEPVGSAAPVARANHAAAANEAEGTVMVHGGRGAGGDVLGDVWAFTPGDAAWEQLDDGGGKSKEGGRPPPVHSHAAAARNGALYVFGGARGDGTASGATWRFQVATREWTELTSAQAAGARPSARVGPAAVAWGGGGAGGGFFVLGGWVEGGASGEKGGGHVADAWRFDAGTERWTRMDGSPGRATEGTEVGVPASEPVNATTTTTTTTTGATPPGHSRAAAAVAPGALFLFGGEGDDAYHGTLWRLAAF